MPTFLANALKTIPPNLKETVAPTEESAIEPRHHELIFNQDDPASPIFDFSSSKLADTLAQRLEKVMVKNQSSNPRLPSPLGQTQSRPWTPVEEEQKPRVEEPRPKKESKFSLPMLDTAMKSTDSFFSAKKHSRSQSASSQGKHGRSLSISTQDMLMATTGSKNCSIWHAAEEGNYDALKAHLDGCSSPRELKAMVNGRDPSTDASLLHLVITHANPPLTAFSTTSTVTPHHPMPPPSQYATSAPETRLAMVRLLLESGADASSTNVYNVQPIHMVSLHFPLHAVSFLKALLEFGANIHARDGDGWTPLHYAARFCQPPKEAMQLLVEHGADVNAVDDSNHKSCLYGLIANGDHLACFQWMVEHGQANIQSRGLFTFFYSSSPTSTLASPSSVSVAAAAAVSSASSAVSAHQQQASLIFQTIKYARIQILRYLVDTQTHQLRLVVSGEEVEQAKAVLEQATTEHPSQSLELLEELDRLSQLLESIPQSLVWQSKHGSVTSPTKRRNLATPSHRSSVLRSLSQFLMKHKRPS